jgi:glutathione S-transferase
MSTSSKLTLFHSPNTRSSCALNLLLELDVPYELHVLNFKTNEQREPAYLAINPMGKVPAIKHGDALVTEQVAIFLYLADLFPQNQLAPTINDPLRGPYLRWMIFYAACMEPACMDRAMKREPASLVSSPYGDFASMIGTVTTQLSRGPWMLGEKFTAADVLWGTALTYMTGFGIVESTPAIKTYTERWNSRPSVARLAAIDKDLLARQSG